jgi:hypothetical protein
MTRQKILGWVGTVWGGFVVLTNGLRIVTGEIAEGAHAGQLFTFALGALMLLAGIRLLGSRSGSAAGSSLLDFATRYTDAWCSQNPGRVAEFFAKHGSLTINRGTPAVGRDAITEAARGFMTAFPDMIVTMDRLEEDNAESGTPKYHWTLTGTNTGPGGTGHSVRISGYEEWLLGSDGLIVDSQGHFDEAEYQRQLREGVEPRP